MNKGIRVLLTTTILSGIALSSSTVLADNDPVIDEVNVTVPVSCTLSGTGMDTHITELQNTESDSSIGESTITAHCNDLNGFAIYAVGFTNNEYGNNYLIDSNLPSTANIATGTATSGNTSNWAMKLTPLTGSNPAPTYPIAITGSADDTDKTVTTPDYTAFQPVPNEYALVAKRKASTDVGTNAEGSTFKTTYQAYVSPTQNAGTYTGQVRYTLVHPHNHAVPDPPSFKVLYTGRPISTESGSENPVTVLMSDLPQDGKYNLLGTSNGQYDKLTPDTLYGGYYKDIVESVEEFSYTNETGYYDGTNFNWLVSTPETTDAAEIMPEEGVTYYVKEVNSTRYIRMGTHWTYGGDDIKTIWFFTGLDDKNYAVAGFDYANGDDRTTYIARGINSAISTYPVNNPSNITTHTAASLFKAYGENNQVAHLRDDSEEIINDTVESFSINGFWVTQDGYKVTGRRQLNAITNGWHNSTISITYAGIPMTITKINTSSNQSP